VNGFGLHWIIVYDRWDDQVGAPEIYCDVEKLWRGSDVEAGHMKNILSSLNS
jgi:hypothetical protein